MKIVVGEQLINYADDGEGSVILMLHGWGAHLGNFDMMVRQLNKKHRVIRLDFPGFGGSPQPTYDWTISDYATFVAAFLKKIGVEDVYSLIAHSFGGRVTVRAIENEHINPRYVVLIGSGGIKHSSSIRQQAFKLVAKSGKQITRLPGMNRLHSNLRSKLYQSAGASDYIDAGDMKQIFLYAINEDLRESAAKITAPTLLIWGENDVDSPLADAKIFHEKIKNSKLIVIEDAGHFVFLDQPKKVMSEINGFLK